MENFDILQGKDLLIDALTLSSLNGQLDITVTTNPNSGILSISFINVSSLFLKDVSYPMCLQCIEIIDNMSRGWMPEVRYHIYDLEDNHMNFYCQHITINAEKENI